MTDELKACGQIEVAAKLLESKLVYDFSGFKIFENSMLDPNEIIIMCGSKIYKKVIDDSTRPSEGGEK